MRKKATCLILILTSALLSTSSATAGAKCLTISSWYPKQLLLGNENGTGKLTFISAAAVKSPDFKKVYFIAVKFKASGVGAQVGVWALSGNLPQKAGDVSGLTLSANTIAQQFTVWPDGNKSQAQISVIDPSISAASKCLK